MDDVRDEWIILDSLVGIILNYRPGCVVEIGVGEGFSTRILFKHVKNAMVPFYTCDINSKISFDYEYHYHYLGSSFNFMKEFIAHPSVVFIDGDHSEEIVSKEVSFFLEKLVVGGVIFMHDTYSPDVKNLAPKRCSTSYKVRQYYEKQIEICDCFTWPYTAMNCGLTMIIKKSLNRPFYRE